MPMNVAPGICGGITAVRLVLKQAVKKIAAMPASKTKHRTEPADFALVDDAGVSGGTGRAFIQISFVPATETVADRSNSCVSPLFANEPIPANHCLPFPHPKLPIAANQVNVIRQTLIRLLHLHP